VKNFNYRRCRGSQHANAKLTEENVIAIRRAYENEDSTMSQLAEHYGVSTPVIWNIVHERSWRHCLEEERAEV
jgi:hypothetical protein